MADLLEVCNLTVEFPRSGKRFACRVRDLSFSLGSGEVLGVVGESGSGKSITSLAVMGLLPPQARTQGQISFTHGSSHDLLRMPNEDMRHLRGSSLAMIFQEPMTALNPVMRVGAQIAEAVRAHHPVSKKEDGTALSRL